jgi:polysaccharide biosynthesis protein PslG
MQLSLKPEADGSSRVQVHPGFALLVLVFAAISSRPAHSQTTPEPDVPDALGVNIHFTAPQPGEMPMLAASGVGWVRMDLSWAATESVKGQYDFSTYDGLAEALEAHHLRALFILDYSNPLYDHGLSPASEEARAAFASWAAAAVSHFRGHGYLWEIYNEPNFHFWTPHPNRDDYIKLALATSEAIEEAASGEKIIGPATAVIDPPYLQACFRAGLLNYWYAVSIHPYRSDNPETVAQDLRQVRLLVREYAPPGKRIPIIASEFGYSSVWPGMDEAKQAAMLAREWLTDVSNDVVLTVWYDWRDDGPDPKNPEDHFGLVGLPPAAAGSVPPAAPYRIKPAYLAAQSLTRFFAGYHFNKRLALGNADDYALLFSHGDELRLAVWTSAAPHKAEIPVSRGKFDVTSLTGERSGPLQTDGHGLAITLTNEPQYLAPQQPNELLALAAAWQTLPLEIVVRAPGVLPLHLALKNTAQKTLRFAADAEGAPSEAGPSVKARPGAEASLELRVGAISRSTEPTELRVELNAHGIGSLAQTTSIVVSNPLRVTVLPVSDSALPISVTNPSGDAFRGFVAAVQADGLKLRPLMAPLDFERGTKETTIPLPLEAGPPGPFQVGIVVIDRQGDRVLSVPRQRYISLDDYSRLPPGAAPSGYDVVLEGGAEGSAEAAELSQRPHASKAQLSPTRGPEPPTPGAGALQINFSLPGPDSTLRLVPRRDDLIPIPGHPEALGLWMWGDVSGLRASARFIDSTGQTFEEGGPLDWMGWRYVLIYLDKPIGSHSGGANDGVIHYPIHWDSLLVLQGQAERAIKGKLYVSGPTLIYANEEKSR